MSGESWQEERDRIIQLLRAIESGAVTHVDEEDLRQLEAVNPRNLALLKDRLANLNARLGNDKTWQVGAEPYPANVPFPPLQVSELALG